MKVFWYILCMKYSQANTLARLRALFSQRGPKYVLIYLVIVLGSTVLTNTLYRYDAWKLIPSWLGLQSPLRDLLSLIATVSHTLLTFPWFEMIASILKWLTVSSGLVMNYYVLSVANVSLNSLLLYIIGSKLWPNYLKISSVLSGIAGGLLLPSASGNNGMNLLIFLLPLAIPLWYLGAKLQCAQENGHCLPVKTLTQTAIRFFLLGFVVLVLFLILVMRSFHMAMILNWGLPYLAAYIIVVSSVFYGLARKIASHHEVG